MDDPDKGLRRQREARLDGPNAGMHVSLVLSLAVWQSGDASWDIVRIGGTPHLSCSEDKSEKYPRNRASVARRRPRFTRLTR